MSAKSKATQVDLTTLQQELTRQTDEIIEQITELVQREMAAFRVGECGSGSTALSALVGPTMSTVAINRSSATHRTLSNRSLFGRQGEQAEFKEVLFKRGSFQSEDKDDWRDQELVELQKQCYNGGAGMPNKLKYRGVKASQYGGTRLSTGGTLQLLANNEQTPNVPNASRSEEDAGFLSTVESNVLNSDERRPYCIGFFEVFVQSYYFDYISAFLIAVQAISCGFQIDYMARRTTTTPPPMFQAFNHAFNFLFCSELLLRACVYRSTFYMYVGRNIMDTSITILLLVDELAGLLALAQGQQHAFHPGITVLRLVRVVRLIRIIRLPRFLSIAGELRGLFASILDSFTASFWVLLLMMVTTYCFAVFLTEIVTHTTVGTDIESASQGSDLYLLTKRFGTLDRTMLSLYYCSLHGMDWHLLVDPLMGANAYGVAVVVILYMTFMMLIVLNTVTSNFVTSALKGADEDRKQVLMIQMRDFFTQCDEDNSGTITWDEFQKRLQHPQLLKFLKEIDLSPNHARALYHLLDVDGSEDVPINEIVSGCVRLHGAATSIDLATFMRAHEEYMAKWLDHAQFVETVLYQFASQPPTPFKEGTLKEGTEPL